MDKNEIDNYCQNGVGICVYRKRVKKAQFIVQSISILRAGNSGGYYIPVEFDSLRMIGQGEGIRWGAKTTDLDLVIESLELFIKKPILEWANHTRTGYQPFYDSEIVTEAHYQTSWDMLNEKYKQGKLLLPKGLMFELQTPDVGTLKNQSKYQRPKKQK
ncbi:MAG: hypothetical protein R2747_13370 [Pyrinomonadaceae bacterium]